MDIPMSKVKNSKSRKKQNVPTKTDEKEENPLTLELLKKKEQEARISLTPEFRAMNAIATISKTSDSLDIVCLHNALKENAERVVKGDTQFIENMLVTQAQTLDIIFNHMAIRSSNSEYLKPMDHKMRLALKAQSQCRATLETLANIKNPPHLAFVKQQNVAYQQQINNGTSECSSKTFGRHEQTVASHAREEKNIFSQNELLEKNDNVTRLELRASNKTISTNSELETVE